jgi:pilus assembly protein Flp/PilA
MAFPEPLVRHGRNRDLGGAATQVTTTRSVDGEPSEEFTVPNPFLALYALTLTAGDRLKAIRSEEKGASAVEYALLVGLIAAIVVGAVALFGDKLDELFTNINVNGTE